MNHNDLLVKKSEFFLFSPPQPSKTVWKLVSRNRFILPFQTYQHVTDRQTDRRCLYLRRALAQISAIKWGQIYIKLKTYTLENIISNHFIRHRTMYRLVAYLSLFLVQMMFGSGLPSTWHFNVSSDAPSSSLSTLRCTSAVSSSPEYTTEQVSTRVSKWYQQRLFLCVAFYL